MREVKSSFFFKLNMKILIKNKTIMRKAIILIIGTLSIGCFGKKASKKIVL